MDLQGNLKLMKTLDDAWNTQDWDTFNNRHAEEVTVYWPGQPEPTRGRSNHKSESVEFFKTIILTMIHIKYYLVRESGLVLWPILLEHSKGP